jgi:hypothetical protein
MADQELILEERFLIFICKDEKKYLYFLVDKDCPNDGRVATGGEVRYDHKFGSGLAGVLFKIEASEHGERIRYSKVTPPQGYWQNTEQRTKWQVRQRAQEDYEALLKVVKTDTLEKILTPIKQAYLTARTRQERSVILARVIDYITK